jgi:hypothetical protein
LIQAAVTFELKYLLQNLIQLFSSYFIQSLQFFENHIDTNILLWASKHPLRIVSMKNNTQSYLKTNMINSWSGTRKMGSNICLEKSLSNQNSN